MVISSQPGLALGWRGVCESVLRGGWKGGGDMSGKYEQSKAFVNIGRSAEARSVYPKSSGRWHHHSVTVAAQVQYEMQKS